MPKASKLSNSRALRDRFIELLESGATYADIQNELKISGNTVRLWKHRLGLPVCVCRIDRDAASRARFIRMIESGAQYSAIMKEFGIARVTVWNWKKRLGLPVNHWYGNGKFTKNYTIYLKKDDRLVCYGTAKQCAAAMGMTMATFRSTVSRNLNGIRNKYDIFVEEIKRGEEYYD